MISEGALRAMRKKAGEGRPPPDLGPMTLARGWRSAVPRAAEDSMGLVAAAIAVNESRISRDDLVRNVPEGSLLALIEGPDENFGLAILDPQGLAGIIEVQTTGRVFPRAAEPRPPTRTDAVIAADFLDRLLELYEQTLAEMDNPPELRGFRYATPLSDPRLVEIALAEGPYQQFTIGLDLERGAKRGELRLAFPALESRTTAAEERDRGFQQALGTALMGASTEMTAVLHRVQMSLGKVTTLAVGDLVEIPVDRLAQVRLAAGGRTVALGRLGQSGGHRAVRLHPPAAAETSDREFAPAGAARPNLPDLDAAQPAGAESGAA